MIESLHPPASLNSAVRSYAETLLKLAPMAVGAMLAIIRQVEVGVYNSEEAEALARHCANSDDVKEGILAIKEKRTPMFKGL